MSTHSDELAPSPTRPGVAVREQAAARSTFVQDFAAIHARATALGVPLVVTIDRGSLRWTVARLDGEVAKLAALGFGDDARRGANASIKRLAIEPSTILALMHAATGALDSVAPTATAAPTPPATEVAGQQVTA